MLFFLFVIVLFFFFFFFFQAEDGIRDGRVTGVQTCALPIYVLDVVGVPRAVDVRVVAVLGLVLDVRGGDRDPARFLLRSVVDLVEGLDLAAAHLLGQHFRDRRGQGRLAVVDVTDRADVDVRLVALELLLRHWSSAPLGGRGTPGFGRTWEI